MVYLEVHPLGGSSPSKTANYNTSVKAFHYKVRDIQQ